MQWLYRLQARWRIIMHHGAEINKRAEVEIVLLEVWKGKRPLLTPKECRELALKLGNYT